MFIKQGLLLIICLGFIGIGHIHLSAQTNQGIFDQDISTFMKNTNEGDWDKVLDMTYPKLFDLVSKDQMKQIFEQMFNSGMKLSTDMLAINKVYAPIKNDTEIFQRIDYNSALNFEFSETDWENKELIIAGMKGQGGFKDIEANDALRTIRVKNISTMIAIKGIDDIEWKYLQYQAGQEMMLGQIMPTEILEAMFPSKN